MKVLLILNETNNHLGRSITKSLLRVGYTVITAYSDQTAINLAQTEEGINVAIVELSTYSPKLGTVLAEQLPEPILKVALEDDILANIAGGIWQKRARLSFWHLDLPKVLAEIDQGQ